MLNNEVTKKEIGNFLNNKIALMIAVGLSIWFFKLAYGDRQSDDEKNQKKSRGIITNGEIKKSS